TIILIESSLRRQKLGLIAAVPLSDQCSRITFALKYCGDIRLVRLKPDRLTGKEHHQSFKLSESDPLWIAPCQHRRPGRGADRRCGIEICESHSILRQCVDMR